MVSPRFSAPPFAALYRDATLQKTLLSTTASGGFAGRTASPVLALVDAVSDRARAASGLPDPAVTLSVLRAGLAAAVEVDDQVAVAGASYRVIKAATDPAGAAWAAWRSRADAVSGPRGWRPCAAIQALPRRPPGAPRRRPGGRGPGRCREVRATLGAATPASARGAHLPTRPAASPHPSRSTDARGAPSRSRPVAAFLEYGTLDGCATLPSPRGLAAGAAPRTPAPPCAAAPAVIAQDRQAAVAAAIGAALRADPALAALIRHRVYDAPRPAPSCRRSPSASSGP